MGGEQGGGTVALVIMGHGAKAALPQGQSQLGPVKRLDLALFAEGQDNGVTARIRVEANDIAQLGDEVRVVQVLELAVAARGQAMGASDLTHRAFEDAGGLGHHHRRPSSGGSSKGEIHDRHVPSRKSPQTPMGMHLYSQRQILVLDLPVQRIVAFIPNPSALRK